MNNYYIKVNPQEMKELLEAHAKLRALESGGVDNWNWYGDSLCDYLRKYGQQEGKVFESFEDIAEYDLDTFYDIVF